MDVFGRHHLSELIASPAWPRVSLYLPTHRRGRETAQGRIRLKNLLRDAEGQLTEGGFPAEQARLLLEPVRGLESDAHFWEYQSDGLAIFADAGGMRSWRLPLPFPETAVVAERFHLKPLLPMITGDQRYFVLALTLKSPRLLEGTRQAIDVIEIAAMPEDVASTLGPRGPQEDLQFHTKAPGGKGGRSAVFHGQGGTEVDKDQIQRYMRRVAEAIAPVLKDEDAPLVLVGVDYLLPIFREANSYPSLLDETLTGSPDEMSPDELHAATWPLVEKTVRTRRSQAGATVLSSLRNGHASTDLAEIVTASVRGRVEILFVAIGIERWGGVDPATGEVAVAGGRNAGLEDLLDRAAIETVIRGGIVYSVEAGTVPAGGDLAATFRF